MNNHLDLDINNYNNKELLSLFDYNDTIPHNKEEIINKYNLKISAIVNSDLRDREKENYSLFIEEVKNKIINSLFDNTILQQYSTGELIINKKNFMNFENNISNTEQPIINKNELPVNPVYNQEHVSGIINPLKKRIIKKILLIDTKFLKEQKNNQNSKFKNNTTNFYINLPISIKNALSMKLASIEIPNTSYTINKNILTNNFLIELDNIKYNFIIPDGNYSNIELVNVINNLIENFNILDKIKLYYDITTNKLSFVLNNNSIFKLDFRDQNNLEKEKIYNLGWILGFREDFYEITDNIEIFNNSTYKHETFIGIQAESIINLKGYKYITVSIKDFKSNVNETFISSYYNSISKSDIIAKIPIESLKNYYDIKETENGIYRKREYFGPQNIEKLEIKILDDYERVIDINKMDISITLEFDCIYNL